MSMLSPPAGVRPREGQFVGDLANLFRRHRVRTGSPEYLAMLGPVLERNTALRSDLLMLCNAISRMAESDLEPDELLQLVGRAVIGPRPADGEIEIPEDLREVFVRGWDEWQARADSLSAMYWGDAPPQAEPAPEMDEETPRAGKFAAAAARDSVAEGLADSSTGAPGSEITPETRIGELTLSQLRTYLEDIEQRVGRLQPYLANLQESLPKAPPSAVAGGLEAELTGDNGVGNKAEGRREDDDGRVTEAVAVPSLAAETNEPAVDDVEQPPALLPARGEEDEPGPRLVLRGDNAAQPQGALDESEPVLFRLVSEDHGRSSRGVLWTMAALLLLAPAAYFGRDYVYPRPAVMPTSPPPAPSSPPYAPTQAATPARPAGEATAASASEPSARPAPRILPKAVRMEAQAARAEQREASSGTR